MTNMTATVLRKAVEHARDNSIAFDMYEWGFEEETCGTTACLAGHILYSQGIVPTVQHVQPHEFSKRAGLTYQECDHLFYLRYWQPEYREMYHNAKSNKQRVHALALQVEYFLANPPK